jgi:serine/threonine-protein kinase
MFSILKEEPPPPSTIDAAVSPAWDPIVMKALAKDRERRFPAAKDFAHAVRDAPAR